MNVSKKETSGEKVKELFSKQSCLLAARNENFCKKTYRLITGAVQIIAAIGEDLEIGREEFIRNDGVNVDEELLENRYDLSGSVVIQAAMAGSMAVLAVPVVTAAAIGERMRGSKSKE